jgi:hypothetical protein
MKKIILFFLMIVSLLGAMRAGTATPGSAYLTSDRESASTDEGLRGEEPSSEWIARLIRQLSAYSCFSVPHEP